MDEQHNGFDHQADPTGPDIDPNQNHDDTSAGQEPTPRNAGREMLAQLQQMIDTVSYQAGPVVREVGAKAAELAAIAGAKAGPLAHKAADATDQFGQRVASRSKTIADDLRRKNEEGQAEHAEQSEQSDQPDQSDSSDSNQGDSTPGF